jgi:hypothetical protein
MLRGLGFIVERGKRGNHHTFMHRELSNKTSAFVGDSFDAGHGNNPEVKAVYVKKIVRLLNKYQSSLQAKP